MVYLYGVFFQIVLVVMGALPSNPMEALVMSIVGMMIMKMMIVFLGTLVHQVIVIVAGMMIAMMIKIYKGET